MIAPVIDPQLADTLHNPGHVLTVNLLLAFEHAYKRVTLLLQDLFEVHALLLASLFELLREPWDCVVRETPGHEEHESQIGRAHV